MDLGLSQKSGYMRSAVTGWGSSSVLESDPAKKLCLKLEWLDIMCFDRCKPQAHGVEGQECG